MEVIRGRVVGILVVSFYYGIRSTYQRLSCLRRGVEVVDGSKLCKVSRINALTAITGKNSNLYQTE